MPPIPCELPRRVHRRRCRPQNDAGPNTRVAPSHPPLLSSWTYRLALPRRPPAKLETPVGRSGTFIGQCCQPLCSGDPARHLDGPTVVPEYRQSGELDRLPGLQQAPELGPPSRPKRDTSQTIFAWPLHRHRLPGDPGCIPPSTPSVRLWTSIAIDGVRAKISRRARTRPGRIKFHATSFLYETAPFMTKPTTPATHAKPEAQAKDNLQTVIPLRCRPEEPVRETKQPTVVRFDLVRRRCPAVNRRAIAAMLVRPACHRTGDGRRRA